MGNFAVKIYGAARLRPFSEGILAAGFAKHGVTANLADSKVPLKDQIVDGRLWAPQYDRILFQLHGAKESAPEDVEIMKRMQEWFSQQRSYGTETPPAKAVVLVHRLDEFEQKFRDREREAPGYWNHYEETLKWFVRQKETVLVSQGDLAINSPFYKIMDPYNKAAVIPHCFPDSASQPKDVDYIAIGAQHSLTDNAPSCTVAHVRITLEAMKHNRTGQFPMIGYIGGEIPKGFSEKRNYDIDYIRRAFMKIKSLTIRGMDVEFLPAKGWGLDPMNAIRQFHPRPVFLVDEENIMPPGFQLTFMTQLFHLRNQTGRDGESSATMHEQQGAIPVDTFLDGMERLEHQAAVMVPIGPDTDYSDYNHSIDFEAGGKIMFKAVESGAFRKWQANNRRMAGIFTNSYAARLYLDLFEHGKLQPDHVVAPVTDYQAWLASLGNQ